MMKLAKLGFNIRQSLHIETYNKHSNGILEHGSRFDNHYTVHTKTDNKHSMELGSIDC